VRQSGGNEATVVALSGSELVTMLWRLAQVGRSAAKTVQHKAMVLCKSEFAAMTCLRNYL
jgi:hypothetical protein